jgi:hypothetical protein
MSHFAEIGDNNLVTRVVVGDNNDPNGDEGYQWLLDNLGGRWIQTSYNSTIRGNFAGDGYSYLEDLDVFMPPKCHDEATLIKKSAKWKCANSDHEITIDVQG